MTIVFGATTATLASLGSLSYREGHRTAPLIRFLDPRMAPTVDEAFVSYPVEYALRSRERNDVVFLGDSTCHDDIDPAQLAHLTSYNLGSLGSIGPVGILLTAKAYLDTHPSPRAIVLCLSPLRFEVSSGSGGGHVVRRLVASYAPEVGDILPYRESAAYFVRRGAIEFSGGNRGLPLLDEPLRGMEAETYRTLQRRMSASRGFFALPGWHGGRWQVETPAPKTFILDEWKDGLKRLAALCRSHDVALVVRFGPIWEGVAQSRDFRQLDEWSDEFEQTGAIVRRPVVAAWDRESMWDCLHLNAHGVSRFAPIVARDVQQALNLPAR